MKRIIIILLLIFSISTLSSCKGCKIKNDSRNYPNGFDVTVSEELLEYFIYKDDVPKLHFDMENVNVTVNSKSNHYILVNNDFYLASEAWGKHLSRYNKDEIIVISEVNQEDDKGEAKFGSEFLKLDPFDEEGNVQKYSKEKRIVAWDKDGTRYSYKYRTFVSNQKRYYIYCYSESLTLAIEQPLIVIKQNGNNKLLLVPLPFDTKYEVSGANLTVDALINKDTYLGDRYRKYIYPDSLKDYSLAEKIEKVKEWYSIYCNGLVEDDKFVITYAGAKFEINFNTTKRDASSDKIHDAFELIYLGDA